MYIDMNNSAFQFILTRLPLPRDLTATVADGDFNASKADLDFVAESLATLAEDGFGLGVPLSFKRNHTYILVSQKANADVGPSLQVFVIMLKNFTSTHTNKNLEPLIGNCT